MRESRRNPHRYDVSPSKPAPVKLENLALKHADLWERVGLASDRIDNVLSARSFMPPRLRDIAEPAILKDIRNELRDIVRLATGQDPWEGHPDDS